MDIIQGNKVVAEYMGIDTDLDEAKSQLWTGHGVYGKWKRPIEYHDDWNQFMKPYSKFREEETTPVSWLSQPKEVRDKWDRLEMSILFCDLSYAFKLLVELINWKNK